MLCFIIKAVNGYIGNNMKALFVIIYMMSILLSASAQQTDSIGYSELLLEYESLDFSDISARYGSPCSSSAYPYINGQCLVSDKLDVRFQQQIQESPNIVIVWFTWNVDNDYQIELFYAIKEGRLLSIDGFKHVKTYQAGIDHYIRWNPNMLLHALDQVQTFREFVKE